MNPNIQNKQKAFKSYQGFEEGTYAARKGRLCFIKKIHFEMHPPAVTVEMMDTQTEVGTEFNKLQHVKLWYCNMCTAPNHDINATQCGFCKAKRKYDEKIEIQDMNEKIARMEDSLEKEIKALSDHDNDYETEEDEQEQQDEQEDEQGTESGSTEYSQSPFDPYSYF